MPRLSIDVSDQQHQHLKVAAALNGLTIKDFVLSRALHEGDSSDMGEEAALHALQGLLAERLQEVRDGKTVRRSSEEIKAKARKLRDGAA